MTLVFLVSMIVMSTITFADNVSCWLSDADDLPMRLVVIKGRATYFDQATKKEIPASGETLIFRKNGCKGCFLAANPDANGNFRILAGDGVYQVIVTDPTSPGIDLLEKGQNTVVDTGSKNGPNQVFELDLRIISRSSP